MAREIPGFYFDAEKKKYFKIQPNQAVSSAAKYSHQSVKARNKQTKAESHLRSHQERLAQETLRRSRWLTQPLLGQLQLDSLLGGWSPNKRLNITASIASCYAAELSRRHVFRAGDQPDIRHFDVHDPTGALITDIADAPGPYGVLHFRRDTQSSRVLYPLPLVVMVAFAPANVDHILVTKPPLSSIVWTVSPGTADSAIYLTHLQGQLDSNVPDPAFDDFERDGFQNSNYNGIVSYNFPDCDFWALAATQTSSEIGVACSRGLVLIRPTPWDFSFAGYRARTETMTVEYKDQHTVLGGQRSGAVYFYDRRMESSIRRVNHSRGVSATKVLPDDHSILVRGMEEMSVYDLRFTGAPKSSERSKPYTTFSEFRGIDSYGSVFDYDPLLGLIASGNKIENLTSSAYSEGITLFSTRTGQAVKSPFDAYHHQTPVTCLKFARIRDGPSSILIASNGEIEEWNCQGVGFESEEAE